MNNISKIIIIFVLCNIICSPVNAYEIENKKNHKLLRVTGNATLDVPADLVSIQVVVQTFEKAASSALANNKNMSDSIFKTLQKLQLEELIVATEKFSMSGKRDRRKSDNNLVGYTVRNKINITFKSLSKIQDVLTQLAEAEHLEIRGVFFSVGDKKQAISKVRKLAVANALQKAEEISEALNLKLGQIFSVQENTPSQSHQNYYNEQYKKDSAKFIFSSPQVIAASISVAFIIE